MGPVLCVNDRYGASIYVTMTDVGQYCVSVTDVGPVQCVSDRCGASTYVAMKDWGHYCVSVTDVGPVLCVGDRCSPVQCVRDRCGHTVLPHSCHCPKAVTDTLYWPHICRSNTVCQ